MVRIVKNKIVTENFSFTQLTGGNRSIYTIPNTLGSRYLEVKGYIVDCTIDNNSDPLRFGRNWEIPSYDAAHTDGHMYGMQYDVSLTEITISVYRQTNIAGTVNIFFVISET